MQNCKKITEAGKGGPLYNENAKMVKTKNAHLRFHMRLHKPSGDFMIAGSISYMVCPPSIYSIFVLGYFPVTTKLKLGVTTWNDVNGSKNVCPVNLSATEPMQCSVATIIFERKKSNMVYKKSEQASVSGP